MKTISIQLSRENYQALQSLYTTCSSGYPPSTGSAHALAGLLDQLRPHFPVPIVLPDTFGSVVSDDTGEVYILAHVYDRVTPWVNSKGDRVPRQWLAEQPGARIRRRGALGPQEIARCL